jgi:UDP-N-acetylmuramoyl-tripeptide--D-alanyl-D-alanine ligase
MTLALAHQLLPGSQLVGDPTAPIHRVHSDTRSLQQGDLFVALKGDHYDGHDFLPALVNAKPCVAAVLSHQPLAGLGLSGLVVADTRRALGLLAANWRQHLCAQHPIPLIAVAGSNGKTTVTQMLASILRAWHGEAALATLGNLNNGIGVPLTLLRLRSTHQSAVIEMGMNHVGEMAQLAQMAAATVGLVNNAQREHQEFMGSVAAVAQENAAVIEHLAPTGTAVFPADDAHTPLWRQIAGQRAALTFNFEDADVTATYSWQDAGWLVSAKTPHGLLHYTLQIAGRHNVKNSLAAVACAVAAGVPAHHIEAGLSTFSAVAGRSKTTRLVVKGQPTVMVDDTYNANPDSVIAAIDMLMDLPAPRLLILGDMGEVGDLGPSFHAEVGAYAKVRGVDQFLTLGDMSRSAGGSHARDMPTLLASVTELIQAGKPWYASILVKGSRFMRMEKVIQHIERLSDVA